jgi:gag-polyprotein putative aspartyl protease
MSRLPSIPLILIMATWIAPPATLADRASAEAVLRDAGLTRRSPSYVLKGELEAVGLAHEIDELRARLAVPRQKYRELQGRYNSHLADASRLRNEARKLEYNSQTKRYEETTDNSKLSEADRHERDAARIGDESLPLKLEIDDGERAIDAAQVQHGLLVQRALVQYAELAARPEIQAALRELNRGTRPKLALGPIADYQANVVRQSAETMVALGFRREGLLYWLPEDATFIEQADRSHRLWRRIGAPERRPASPAPAATGSSPLAKRPGAASPGPTPPRPAATPPTPPRSPATAGGSSRPAASPAMTAPLPASPADERAELVRLVRRLRRQADALQGRRDALLVDVEARDSLEAINRARRKANQARIGTRPGLKVAIQQLEAMERAIRSEVIPLTRDGELLKVSVLINGRPTAMAVEPATPLVSLPDPLAAESNVRPDPGPRTIPSPVGEGRAIPARTARIGSLRVGASTVEGVECLVLPPGPGDGPPVLGGSFLNRVMAELDVGAATLTLTHVDPPPTSTPEGRRSLEAR